MPLPVAKLKASDTPDVMRTEDGIDTIIRQAIGKDSLLYIPRANENPGQLIQLLSAFDQLGVTNVYSEYPGWPLLYPLKAPSDKCEKCSQEFCSTINYRRHLPVHHRFKKLDKDTSKTRDLLGAYWDKLSVEEAKEVLSFENVMLEEVPGSSILNALVTLNQKQGFFLLPQCYMRAGVALLDILQSNPSSFPIPSRELFSILDDASERTFLLGTAVSMQKHVFHGGAGKIGLQPKNTVACISFLLEQILVKAWLADKDAEALRCQKQLVEEEEAAQKRQAEILMRKRQKKLRQKEHRAREQRDKLEEETKGSVDSTLKTLSPAESFLDTCDFEAQNPEEFANNTPSHVPIQFPDVNEGKDGDTPSGLAFGSHQIIGQSECGLDHPCRAVARWQEPPKSPQRTVVSDLHTHENPPILKPEVIQRYGTCNDHREDAMVNAGKAWNSKPKPEIDIAKTEPDPVNNHEVLIGSISVNLGKCSQSEGNVVASQEDCSVENVDDQNSSQDKPKKPDLVKSGNNQATVKTSTPVSQFETKDSVPVQSHGTEVDAGSRDEGCKKLSRLASDGTDVGFNKIISNLEGHVDPFPVSQFETKDSFPVQSHGTEVDAGSRDEGCQNLSRLASDGSDVGFKNKISNLEGHVDPGKFQFNIQAAKAFLAQRWEEAISSNHVKLVISYDSEPPGSREIQDLKVAAACEASDGDDGCSNIPAKAVNKLLSTTKASKSKRRGRSKKGTDYKNIPKEKTT
ncbi:unnamed protein product [Trifolium pratense]|uniref:Uncharacterized protein n=1 Tax=Trifolium pratense TaxID=57577 RepID=A0ACB0LDQ9_TRIPR|nr:unnamed protein product [Trifolium pratense]